MLGAVAVVALGAAAMTLAASGEPPPRKPEPARGAGPAVSVGEPIEPYRAGSPPDGWIELRADDPQGGPRYAVLYHGYRTQRGGRTIRHVCSEHGPEAALRRYPVREGGSCAPVDPPPPDTAVIAGLASGIDRPASVHGQVRPDVERLVVSGPGGTHDVPLSRHRAFLVLYRAETRGTVTLTAHLRDGSTSFQTLELPPEALGDGYAEAADPEDLPGWTVEADRRVWGSRKGQTCAQFHQQTEVDGPRDRTGSEFGPPMCGDLREHALFADATTYGPRAGQHTFGPGPGSPERLIVWGAAARSVKAVRVTGPDGVRELPFSDVGRAFITVYPATVAPSEVTVEATLADGSTLRHPAPRRVNTASARP